MNITKIESKLESLKKKTISYLLLFTLSLILIDYLFTTVFFSKLYDSVHSLEISGAGSLIIITVILMTERFKELIQIINREDS